MKYFTERRTLDITIITGNALQTIKIKKEALNTSRNQKDLLSLASVSKAVYPNTPCCLTKPYAENSAELNHPVLKIHNGKYTYGSKSKNMIKCSLFCSKEMQFLALQSFS